VLSPKVIYTRSAAVASLESILPVSYHWLAPRLLASIVSTVFDVFRRIASAAENQRASERKKKETGEGRITERRKNKEGRVEKKKQGVDGSWFFGVGRERASSFG
jgi:hypothetical protein